MNTPTRYHPLLVTLHWLTVIFMFGAGLLSEDEGRSPVNVHMVLGAFLLVIMLARLATRFASKLPAPLDAGNPLFNLFARLTHLGLYLIVFFILALGGLVAYNRNLFAYLMNNSVSLTRPGPVQFIHHAGWLLAIALVTVHVGAALYHQFVLRDRIFSRIWYGK